MNTINNINSTPQFKGFYLRKIPRQIIQNESCIIANILSQDTNTILALTQKSSKTKLNFFRKLADKYNQTNFYRQPAEKENPAFTIEIFKNITSPKKAHFDFISEFNGSIEALYRVFSNSLGSKKRLNFAQKFNKEILSHHKNINENLLPELLESENSKEYIKNFNKYKSYFILNRNEKGAVKNLDAMINNGTYNQIKYDNIKKRNLITSRFPFKDTANFNAELFAENYSKESHKLLETIRVNYYITDTMFENGNDKDLLAIFKSTTKQNYKLRYQIIKTYHEKFATWVNQHATNNSNIEELSQLFKKIDEDKHAKSFITKMLKNNIYMDSPREINKILNNVSNLKLDIFSKNAENIIKQTRTHRIETLQNEIQNPFFETKSMSRIRHSREKNGYTVSKSVISHLKKNIANQFNILRYNIAKRNYVAPISEAPVTVKSETKSPVAVTEIVPQVTKVNPKEEIIQNTFTILNTKLGAKTLDRQSHAFKSNATKIRLSMLPEIFTSIADTRRADRAVGKHRMNSSNKDALDLFLLINGNNKKYVNYLLKKRNVDNTRMFEVKEIINMIKKAEAKIAEQKKLNPDYKARNARSYYNHLFEAKIQQYGKVTRQSKVNTKA